MFPSESVAAMSAPTGINFRMYVRQLTRGALTSPSTRHATNVPMLEEPARGRGSARISSSASAFAR